MSIREEQCRKVCRILDDVLANRPTERDALCVAVDRAFEALSRHETCKTCSWSSVVVEADKGNILQCENKNGLNRNVWEEDFCSYWEEMRNDN